jgi:hypothetical protein
MLLPITSIEYILGVLLILAPRTQCLKAAVHGQAEHALRHGAPLGESRIVGVGDVVRAVGEDEAASEPEDEVLAVIFRVVVAAVFGEGRLARSHVVANFVGWRQVIP